MVVSWDLRRVSSEKKKGGLQIQSRDTTSTGGFVQACKCLYHAGTPRSYTLNFKNLQVDLRPQHMKVFLQGKNSNCTDNIRWNREIV